MLVAHRHQVAEIQAVMCAAELRTPGFWDPREKPFGYAAVISNGGSVARRWQRRHGCRQIAHPTDLQFRD